MEKGLILISTQKQILYRYIFEEALSSGKTEIDIIKDLLSVDIDKFYSSYRKWKERFKAEQKKHGKAI